MEATLNKLNKTITKQDINFIDNTFTASEASDIINAILDVKINFHKVKKLSITEGNSEDLCEYDNGRITELVKEKETAKDFFKAIRLEGRKLKIKSSISIVIEE